ncbi:MAG: glycosyltransferase [Bacteroidota bacterium]
MKVAFICVNYNNASISISYIENVQKIKSNNNVKIIVVDNASKEGDYKILNNYIENLQDDSISLIRSKQNLGYFNGLNIGIKQALNDGFNEYQIIGNNDIEFSSDFLEVLRVINLKENEMILSPDVVTTEGIHENPHVIEKISFFRWLKHEVYFSSYYIACLITLFYSAERKPKLFDSERKYIHMGIGALYVLTPNFFSKFSELWDKVFLYGEEAILSGQILSVDGKILYEPTLRCFHNESATTSKLTSKSKYKITRESYKIYKKYL